jgi:hypothetical protein
MSYRLETVLTRDRIGLGHIPYPRSKSDPKYWFKNLSTVLFLYRTGTVHISVAVLGQEREGEGGLDQVRLETILDNLAVDWPIRGSLIALAS